MRIHRHTFNSRGEGEQIHVRMDGDNIRITSINSEDYEHIELVMPMRRASTLSDRIREVIDEQSLSSIQDRPPVPMSRTERILAQAGANLAPSNIVGESQSGTTPISIHTDEYVFALSPVVDPTREIQAGRELTPSIDEEDYDLD